VRLAVPVAAALCSLVVLTPVASGATPKPETGRSVVVQRASGTVLFSKRGSNRATRLGRAARKIPVGSTIDASNGRVKLTSTANRSGSKRQSAVFYDGAFTVKQNRSSAPLTDLELVGGDFSPCPAGKRTGDPFVLAKFRSDVFAAGSSARRRLWGRGRGRFRTRGRNGTATVRGTTWLTEDLCEGTRATAQSGEIEANAIDLELQRQLEPGQSVIYYCNTDGAPPLSSLYCLVVLSQPADNIFGFGFATSGTAANEYQLCILEPDQNVSCGNFPFGPEEEGIKAGGVGCLPAQAGEHYVGWGLEGQILPIPLPFTSNATSNESFCVSSPPRPGIDPPAKAPPSKLGKARAAAGIGD
jgi:hypothetical protein